MISDMTCLIASSSIANNIQNAFIFVISLPATIYFCHKTFSFRFSVQKAQIEQKRKSLHRGFFLIFVDYILFLQQESKESPNLYSIFRVMLAFLDSFGRFLSAVLIVVMLLLRRNWNEK